MLNLQKLRIDCIVIPRIIHYIWFGNNPYPPKVQHCIESWKRIMPQYEFMLWNESTFDVNKTTFTQQAYSERKWAFVSDYVRIYALYKYGGWYLDTDVEIVKPLSPFEKNRVVLGTDDGGYLTALMGSEPEHPYWKEILNYYESLRFIDNGTLNMTVNNTYLQDVLYGYGYVVDNILQHLREGIVVYPDDYFHVASLTSGKLHRTSNTCAIHWHTLTWVSKKTKFVRFIRMHILCPILGDRTYTKITSWLKKLWNK